MAGKLAALILVAMAPQAQGGDLKGTYSNVCVYRETGDLDGIELQIGQNGDQPTVSLQTCEGGCWQQPTSEIVITGNRITFSSANQDFDVAGKLVNTTVHRFTATVRGNLLTLESPDYTPSRLNLQRQMRVTSTTDFKARPLPVRRCR